MTGLSISRDQGREKLYTRGNISQAVSWIGRANCLRHWLKNWAMSLLYLGKCMIIYRNKGKKHILCLVYSILLWYLHTRNYHNSRNLFLKVYFSSKSYIIDPTLKRIFPICQNIPKGKKQGILRQNLFPRLWSQSRKYFICDYHKAWNSYIQFLTQCTITYPNSKSVLLSNYQDEKQNCMLWK